MDFNRFGRLNQKKLNEYINNAYTPYNFGCIFPRLNCKSIQREAGDIINLFKRMSKKYRFCYTPSETCIAMIKRKDSQGEYVECKEIDNKVYVFTNLDYEYLEQFDYELVYDRDAQIKVHSGFYIESDIDIFSSVFSDLKKRRNIQKDGIKNLKEMLNSINFLPTTFDELLEVYPEANTNISKPLFEEFRWRCLLIDTNIYKTNSKKEDAELLKLKKTKIEDKYSILSNTFKYYSFDNFTNDLDSFKKDFEELFEYQKYGLKRLLARKAVELKENNLINYWINRLNEYSSFETVFIEKIESLEKILETYSFLDNSYSKKYKEVYNKYRKVLSKGQAYRVLKRFKEEYLIAQDTIEKLNSIKEEVIKYESILKTIEVLYQGDIGDNQIQNNGYGIVGDGWNEDIIEDDNGNYDVMADIRAQEQHDANMEEDELARFEKEHEEEYYKEEFQEEDQSDEKQFELDRIYFELDNLYNEGEPIFRLLKKYYDLDFSTVKEGDEILFKFEELVLDAPYAETFYLKNLIRKKI